MGKNNKAGKSQNVRSDDATDASNFIVVLFYCLLIIFSPVVAFFGFKLFVFDLSTTPVRSNIYSAVVAVVTLHIALGLYLYRASYDSSKASTAKQQKED